MKAKKKAPKRVMPERVYSNLMKQNLPLPVRDGRKTARLARVHYEHPQLKVSDQSQGFDRLLVHLYELEDELSPVGHCSAAFAEARAICELFLPPFRVQALRRKYGEEPG
jgi:hypothetical protein